jgi:hypothetical protein
MGERDGHCPHPSRGAGHEHSVTARHPGEVADDVERGQARAPHHGRVARPHSFWQRRQRLLGHDSRLAPDAVARDPDTFAGDQDTAPVDDSIVVACHETEVRSELGIPSVAAGQTTCPRRALWSRGSA